MTREEEVRREDFLKDLQSGMADHELMTKYHLTPRGLGTLFRNLVNADLITFTELIRISTGQLNLPEVVAEYRTRSRKQVEFLLPITDSEHPENTGFVYDVTDDGIGTRGLKTQVGEMKTFVIPADDYFQSDPVVFRAVCRWVDEKTDRWESGAGFKVVSILKGSLNELQEMIRAIKPDASET
jgi:hypothetical protein